MALPHVSEAQAREILASEEVPQAFGSIDAADPAQRALLDPVLPHLEFKREEAPGAEPFRDAAVGMQHHAAYLSQAARAEDATAADVWSAFAGMEQVLALYPAYLPAESDPEAAMDLPRLKAEYQAGRERLAEMTGGRIESAGRAAAEALKAPSAAAADLAPAQTAAGEESSEQARLRDLREELFSNEDVREGQAIARLRILARESPDERRIKAPALEALSAYIQWNVNESNQVQAFEALASIALSAGSPDVQRLASRGLAAYVGNPDFQEHARAARELARLGRETAFEEVRSEVQAALEKAGVSLSGEKAAPVKEMPSEPAAPAAAPGIGAAPVFPTRWSALAAVGASASASAILFGLAHLALPVGLVLGFGAGLSAVLAFGLAHRSPRATLIQLALLGLLAALPALVGAPIHALDQTATLAVGAWAFLAWSAVQSLRAGYLRAGVIGNVALGLAAYVLLYGERIAQLAKPYWPY